jgi:hypothetical protein
LTTEPKPEALHARHHRLDGEQRRPLVDGHAVVVVRGRDRLERVAVVARHVVDQHREVAELGGRVGDGRLQRADVAHVAGAPPRRGVAGLGDLLGQRGAGLLGDVDKGHARTLRAESTDDGRADAAAAAGDEHRAAAQAGMNGKLGGIQEKVSDRASRDIAICVSIDASIFNFRYQYALIRSAASRRRHRTRKRRTTRNTP